MTFNLALSQISYSPYNMRHHVEGKYPSSSPAKFLAKDNIASQHTSQFFNHSITLPHQNDRHRLINQPQEMTIVDVTKGIRHSTASASPSTLGSTLCNIVDSFITQFLDPCQLKPAVDPKVQLAGNLAPVEESPPKKCREIIGIMPGDLSGIYIRNGPNAGKVYGKGGHHIFDGDGMLHGISIKDGTATYCCRHVRTSRFVQEEDAGRPLFLKFFGGLNGPSGLARLLLFGVRMMLGLVDLTKGWGLANTSVGYFHGKVLALSEDDMPYVINVTEDCDLITLGKLQLKPWKINMCGHPKIDPVTGEMFAFSLNPTSPHFSFFRISPHGVKGPDIPIPFSDLAFVHDFAITEKYIVFPHNQFVLRPLAFFFGKLPVVVDKRKVSRLAVIPRYARPEDSVAQTRWFQVPGCNCLHYLNAWNEEKEGQEEVVIIAPVVSPPELFLDVPADKACTVLTEIRLNLRTGESSQRKICFGNMEFGTYNYEYTGRKMRYVYMLSGSFPRFSGIVKVDLQLQERDGKECIAGRRDYGQDCYGSEPFFVPRGLPRETHHKEDCGYLLSLVHNEATGVSQLLVMDAQSPSLQILACIKLPGRVPYGFHGYFVDETRLSKQSAY